MGVRTTQSLRSGRTEEAPALQGSGLALAGAVLYLLEWVAIVAAQPPGPYGNGTSAATVYRDYAAHAGGAGFAAAWFATCLVGRVLFVAGVRASVPRTRLTRPLFDLALAAMTVSVVLEVAAYAMVAGTARLAADGAARGTVVALDQVAFWVDLVIFAPAGLSIATCAVAMRLSRAYPPWQWALGAVAGVAGVLGTLAMTTASRPPSGLGSVLETVAALGMWVFMISVGITLLRHRREPEQSPAPAPTAVA